MFSNNTPELSFEAPIRAIDAVRAEKTESLFVAATCNLSGNENNLVHLVQFQSDLDQLFTKATLTHPDGPTQKICSNPLDKSLLITLGQQSSSAALYRIPDEALESDVSHGGGGQGYDADSSLERVAVMSPSGDTTKRIVDVCWRGSEEEPSIHGDVITLAKDGTLTQWDLSMGSAEESRSISTSQKSAGSFNLQPRLAWDPHSCDITAVSIDSNVQVFDWRSATSSGATTDCIQSFKCHRYGVSDINFNPNKPNVLSTAGMDGLLKFWDLRHVKRPLLTARGGHRHWASTVRYNPFHDQLVLSAGTDSVVNLWRISTISSAPLLTLQSDGDDTSATSPPNVRVGRDEHAESVYSVAWGVADPWIYASACFGGKIHINHVPSKEKYKILL